MWSVNKPEVSQEYLIIIPAYNEEKALPRVLVELAEHEPDADILVVDDCSTDRTAEVARKGGAGIMRLPFNLGVGGALRAGFRWAIQNGYERAIQFDGDGQHDARQIPALKAALDQGAELVIGSRFARSDSHYEVSRVRRGAMNFLSFAIWLLSGRKFSDTSSGFRAFDRNMMEFFARHYPVDYLDSVEAVLLALHAGFRVVEVPVGMRVRAGGRPSTRGWKLLYQYLRVLIVMGTSMSLKNRRKREDT
jgi:glycosyltransferase involved in cell wall biosynthesis